MRLPNPHLACRNPGTGFLAVSPSPLLNCDRKGSGDVTQDTEHDEGDEDAEAPQRVEDESEALAEEEESHDAETGAGEQQEASAPKSEKEIERALKAVERAGTTYRNAVSRAMGEDAQAMLPCPRCNAPVAGMVFPPEMAPVDDDTREAVLVSLGIGGDGGSHLNEAKGVRECDTCDGWGQLVFPTKVPHVETQPCPKCIGKGYVNEDAQNVTTIYTAQQPTTTTTAPQNVPPPCPTCGMQGMSGLPHFCNPVAASG